MSSNEESVSGAKRRDLLEKLENPLGFIGEKRLSHVCYRGEWISVEELMIRAGKGPKERDRVLESLRDRLDEIKHILGEESPSRDESVTLFEEALAVKRAIYIIRNRVTDTEDPNRDMKRWLRYGRSIS